MKIKVRIAAFLLAITIVLSFLPLNALALNVSGQFLLPLGDTNSYSFESSSPPGWTIPQGTQSCAIAYLGACSWWTQTYSGDYLMSYQLSNGVVSAIAGKQVIFSFWFAPSSSLPDGSLSQMQAEVTYTFYTCYGCGSPQSGMSGLHSSSQVVPLGLHIYTQTRAGPWVAPTTFKWYNAYVSLTLPPNTSYEGLSLVTVQIHGQNGGSEYIDNAWLQIEDSNSVYNVVSYPFFVSPQNCMDVSLVVALSNYNHVQGGADYNMNAALSARSLNTAACKLVATTLKVTMTNGCAVSNNPCTLSLTGSTQTNSRNYTVSPAANAQVMQTDMEVMDNVIGFGTGAAIGLASLAVGGGITYVLIESAAGGAAGGLFAHYYNLQFTTPDQGYASSSSGYAAWQTWNYYANAHCWNCDWQATFQNLPENSTGEYAFSGFFPVTALQLTITATAYYSIHNFWLDGDCSNLSSCYNNSTTVTVYVAG